MTDDRQTEDERAAIAWWNDLTETARRFWLLRHDGSIPAAWAEHKAGRGQ